MHCKRTRVSDGVGNRGSGGGNEGSGGGAGATEGAAEQQWFVVT